MQNRLLKRGFSFYRSPRNLMGQKPILIESASEAYVSHMAARLPPRLQQFSLVQVLVASIQVMCGVCDRSHSYSHLLLLPYLLLSLGITLAAHRLGVRPAAHVSAEAGAKIIARTKLFAYFHCAQLLIGQLAVEVVEEHFNVKMASCVIHTFLLIYIYYLVIRRRSVAMVTVVVSYLMFFYRTYTRSFPVQLPLLVATLIAVVACITEAVISQERNEFASTWNLRQEKGLYERLLTVLKDPVMIVGHRKLVYANTSCACRLGVNRQNYQRRLMAFLSDSSESLIEKINKTLRTKRAVGTTEECYKFQGADSKETRLYRVYITPSFSNDNYKTLAVIFRDLTEDMEIEEKKAKEQYQTLMFYSIPHELRTPLNIVQGLFSYMKGMKELGGNLRMRLAEAKSWCRYLSNEIANILDYSQFSMNDFALHPTDTCLGRVLSKAVKMTETMLGDKRESVKIDLDNRIGLRKKHFVDPDRFQQVVLNVLSCGLKRVTSGRITVSGIDKGTTIEVVISDSGPERLVAGEGSSSPSVVHNYRTKEDREIVSLRMLVSKKICEKMDGKLTVQDSPTETVTTIAIPTGVCVRHRPKRPVSNRRNSCEWSAAVDENVVPTRLSMPVMRFKRMAVGDFLRMSALRTESSLVQSGMSDSGSGKQTRGTFLVVDDVELNRFVIRSMLKRYNWDVCEASNGEEAVQCVDRVMQLGRSQSFVIFMDIDMPVMNGIQATQSIRRRFGKTGPFIVATTAFTAEAERRNCASAGMNHFIPKPLTQEKIREVLEMLTRWMDR